MDQRGAAFLGEARSVRPAVLSGRVALLSLGVALLLCGQSAPGRAAPADAATRDARARQQAIERLDHTWNSAEQIPVQGYAKAPFDTVDAFVREEMLRLQIPGATLAVTKDGVLVVSRGYGFSDTELTRRTAPNTIMRLASVDKPVLMSAFDRLLRSSAVLPSGRPLARDLGFLEVMKSEYGLAPPPGRVFAPGTEMVTLEHLLQHRSGVTGAMDLGQELGLGRAPTAWEEVQCAMCMPLQFEPGSQTQYSNRGFGLLTMLLEKVTGDYLQFLRSEPPGVVVPASLGTAGSGEVVRSRARAADRDPRETCYWSNDYAPSMLPEDHGKLIPVPEGGGCNVDNQRWIAASAPWLVRHLCTFYITTGKPLYRLNPAGTDVLRDPASGKPYLAPGNDNGFNTFVGGTGGSRAIICQDRWFHVNIAYLANRCPEGRADTNGRVEPFVDVVERIRREVLAKRL